jgi:hypothetical protein
MQNHEQRQFHRNYLSRATEQPRDFKAKFIRGMDRGARKLTGQKLSCLGRVFNFKLGCFVMYAIAWHMQGWPSLELKTQPRFVHGWTQPGNTKGGSNTVPLTSCLTGLD